MDTDQRKRDDDRRDRDGIRFLFSLALTYVYVYVALFYSALKVSHHRKVRTERKDVALSCGLCSSRDVERFGPKTERECVRERRAQPRKTV